MQGVKQVPYDYNSAMTLAAENDRQWFADHPQHYIRVRHKTDGDPYEGKYILVFSPFVDASIRFRFGFSTPPGEAPPTDKPTLLRLLHCMVEDRNLPVLHAMFWKVMAHGGCLPSPCNAN